MSKKTRKNSPKTSGKQAARKQASVRSPKAAKTRASKTGKSVAAKPGKGAAAPAKKSPSKASQKAASKPLKTAADAALAAGVRAPAFRLPRDGGDSVSLADFAGQKLVVFFYPRADTPGCTREAIDFTRLRSAFESAGTAVLGVSADTLKAQESFRNKHQLTVPLISDEKHEMLDAYGAWGEKSLYGRKFMGIIRTTVLVDRDGKVARIWRNVRVDGHADEVLEAARAL